MTSEQIAPNRKRKKKKKNKVIIAFVFLLVIALAIGAGFLMGNTMIKPPSIHAPVIGNNEDKKSEDIDRVDGIYNVLIVGTDKVALNTDTILVASLDSINNRVNILSIPRDTMSNVSRTVKKINAAYSIGAKDGKGNIDNLKKEVQYLVGFEVDNYVVVNLSAFEELIDAIGGVKIDVPKNMNYDDPYQDLHIHIQAGEQVLNGKQAVGFCRYRSGYVEGDLGRVKAQQLFMKALIRQVATPSTLTKMPQLAKIIEDNMETDLTNGEIIWFAKEAVGVNMEEDLQTYILPGEARYVHSLSYYIPNATDILEIVNEHFNPYETEITLSDLNIVDVASLPREERPQKQEEKESDEEVSDDIDPDNPLEQEVLKPEDGQQDLNGENSDANVSDNENTNGQEQTNGQPDIEENSASGSNAMPGEVLKNENEVVGTENNVAENQNDNAHVSEEMPAGNGNAMPGEVLKDDVEHSENN